MVLTILIDDSARAWSRRLSGIGASRSFALTTRLREDASHSMWDPFATRVAVAFSRFVSLLIGPFLLCPYCRLRGASLHRHPHHDRWIWRCWRCDIWLWGWQPHPSRLRACGS